MHVGIANPRQRGKRSRHSWCMRNRNFTYLVRGPFMHTAVINRDKIGAEVGVWGTNDSKHIVVWIFFSFHTQLAQTSAGIMISIKKFTNWTSHFVKIWRSLRDWTFWFPSAVIMFGEMHALLKLILLQRKILESYVKSMDHLLWSVIGLIRF